MDLKVYSILVILLYAIPTQSSSLDERVSKLEAIAQEQSIQMVQQNRKIELMDGVIVKQQNEIKELTQQLALVEATNRIQNNDISLLKRILRSHLNYSKQDMESANATFPHPGNHDDPKERAKRSMIRESNIPVERSLLGRALTGKTAFYAYMSRTENAPSQHHTLIFDHIVTNINNAYSHYTGTFIAPSAGAYVFTFSIRMGCRAYGAIEFVRKSQVVCSFYNEHNADCEYDTFTGIIVLSINQGDVVFVRTHASYTFSGNIDSNSHGRSSFSGWSI